LGTKSAPPPPHSTARFLRAEFHPITANGCAHAILSSYP
jgi:hypothetical protein